MKAHSYVSVSFVVVLLINTSLFPQTLDDLSYFPLNVGNQWIYEHSDHSMTDTVVVADTQRVDNKLYYAVKENYDRYLWFRKDNEKYYIVDTLAFKLDPSNIKEYLLYDFGAQTGQSWNTPLTSILLDCEYSGTVFLNSKKDTAVTPYGTFDSCYAFLREVQCVDAGRVKEWFAQGIGRVAYHDESISGIRDYLLKWVNIVMGTNTGDDSFPIREFSLSQNYPNPFNPFTTIEFSVPKEGIVSIKIYNSLGEEIFTVFDGYKNAGKYRINFNSSAFSSGVYLYKLQAGGVLLTKKMIVLK